MRLLLLLALVAASPAADWPSLVLEDGETRLDIYLPDPEAGFYRGARFDWAGMVGQMTWRGHTFFAELKAPHDPLLHDHAVGPCEEFGMRRALGWEGTAPGDPFPKIGVGILARDDHPTYRFNAPYPVLDRPAWTVTRTATGVTFAQALATGEWGLRYEKTVRLLPGGGFALDHVLENTGTRPIATDVYNHAMVRLNDRRVGPGYTVDYGMPPEPRTPPLPAPLRVEGTALAFATPFPPGLWTALQVPPRPSRSATVAAGAVALVMTVDRDPEAVELYAEPSAVCPELFIPVAPPPGREDRWTMTFVPVAR